MKTITHGDRKDATRVRDADTMHKFLPFLMPNRADNEAVMTELIDLAPIQAYIDQKNSENPAFKYTFFHVISAALAKTIALRPKLNRFYSGHRLYQRRDISLSFVVKKEFSDNGDEGLAIVCIDPAGDSPLSQLRAQVESIIHKVRDQKQTDGTTDAMDKLLQMPRPILRFAMRFLRFLEYHGWYPRALMNEDPYYTSVFISNLGSIHMHANYHHLANWGTNSIFAIIGEKKKFPVYWDDGCVEIQSCVPLSLTVDERIADGYYYAQSIQLLLRLLRHPDLLDLPTAELPEETEKKGSCVS